MRYLELVQNLEAAGKVTHTVEMGDGSRALLLPHGGRILGLFPRANQENFFWTNPALESVETARRFYASGLWENSGGDRTWLSPEVDLFFPKYPDVSGSEYLQPRALDPGQYELFSEGGKIRLSQQLDLRFFRSNVDMQLRITKWVEPTSVPLISGAAANDLEFAGYEQHTTLHLLAGGPGRVGLWDLLQMPHNGQMVIPTFSAGRPRVYFGQIAAEKLIVDDRCVRWSMSAAGEQKIGIRAHQATGRVGYLYHSGGALSLVVRNFFVNPAASYIDVPWDDHTDEGYAVQACNVNSHLGSFSELEYHVPAIGAESHASSCEDISQLWCYRGNPKLILDVAFNLLGYRGQR